ncbi:MAG: ATP-binding protein [Elusimicrobiales bacterium]|nr:ATP-binding protein [Elusimicrobiales bacterium]
MARRRGKLFYKLMFVLLLVSLGPLALVGYYMLNLSKDVLKQAILTDQRTLAAGLTDNVHTYVMAFKTLLSETSREPELQSSDPARLQEALSHCMQLHAAFIEMSVINSSGNEIVRVGRFLKSPSLRNLSQDELFRSAVKDGQYMGSLERFQGQYPTLMIAVQLLNNATGRPGGVLAGKLNLNGLTSILKTGFPESSQSQAAIIAPDGFLIAHSDMSQVFRPDARLPREVLDILLNTSDREGSGEILMQDGTRVLGAFAEEKSLGWLVYIQQPITVAERATSVMVSKTLKAFGFVLVFALFLGYLVSLIIVQPIQALREAALKLSEGRFEDLPELKMPNDEIGDLAQTFSQMSDSLRIKTAELIAAGDELERLNRSLESRVEARTRELRAAQDELINKERLAAIGQMASVVGHEIRNPLAVINNSAYFIKTKLGAAGGVDPKIEKHIAIIESEIQQANGIISEILGFARTRELMPKPVSLNNYMEELLASYPFPQHVEVERQFAPENPRVNIDAEEMKQAVRNVLGNAVEVMPARGALTVSTRVNAEGLAVIGIKDTGPGIPPDVAEKIFAPFFTTKARGTGLGLAVVKKVLERHRGRVALESAPGAGTLFKLYIPVYKEAPPDSRRA